MLSQPLMLSATACASSGVPSVNFTFGLISNVYTFLSSEMVQWVARPGWASPSGPLTTMVS